MATRTQVVLIDDLDGREIVEGGQTVTFSYKGVDYSIDLGEKNAKKLDDALARFIAHAERVGGRRSRVSKTAVDDTDDPQAIRAWARENGYQVSDRGRVSAELKAAYDAAH
ncbi:MAG TPA: Lsr2 family protein [Propionibacteriaceae bacterium]|nr:Lsr2 family protein [Propionibacteriaceae bacterium]